ncbi:uncharacterized protein BO88DRAFT_352091, partial [Aspergillus vadensis CBS 113365]
PVHLGTDWETPAFYLQALRSPGKTNRAALASSLARFKSRTIMWCRGSSRVAKVPGTVSGHLCACSRLPNVQGHMVTIYEEQNPTLRPEMTVPSQGFGPKASGPQSKMGPTREKKCRHRHGRVKMCATGGTAPLVNGRLRYTAILGKRFQI